MEEDEFVIDIAKEIIKFAYGQGHTKASQDTINWNKLKTKSEKAAFVQKQIQKERKIFSGKDELSQNLYQHLIVSEQSSEKREGKSATAVMQETTKQRMDGESQLRHTNNISVQENCLINATDYKQSCLLTFRQSLCNRAEATIRLVRTISGPSSGNNQIYNSKLQTATQIRPVSRATTKCKQLATVPLIKRFRGSLQLPGNRCRKLSLPRITPHEVVALTLPGVKIPIEIVQHTEKENGTFTADYYLWGQVTVTVWGKPYTMQMTDILDPKRNPSFQKEKRNFADGTSCSDEASQVVKFQLRGVYEKKTVTYEINLKIPSCMLTNPQSHLESRKCACDTTQLPNWGLTSFIHELTDRNLARIILRWRQILFSFRHTKMNNENQWLWNALLMSSTQLGKTAQQLNIEDLSRSSTAIDKFLYTIMLWRDKEVEAGTSTQECTIQLATQLYEIGMPVPVLSFLWSEHSETESTKASVELYHYCPIHQFKPGNVPKLDEINNLQSKLNADLPDRVLARMLQRWHCLDGWLPAALYLGISAANIETIALYNEKFPTVSDKRMTVFKLWRMQHRRDGAAKHVTGQSGNGRCTVRDLCGVLSDMRLPEKVYSFLWTDSETTP